MKKRSKTPKTPKKEKIEVAIYDEEEEEPSFVSSESEEDTESDEINLQEEEEDKKEEEDDDENDDFGYSYSDDEKKKTKETNQHDDAEIFTPDWSASTEESNEENQKTSKPFDMVRVHRRLQIIEYRINNQIDRKHIHPAYSAEIEHTTPDLNETEREILELGNFHTRVEKKIIPRFWPPRCYDDEKDLLSKEKSDELENQILNLHERKLTFNLRDRTKHFTDKDLIKIPNKKLKISFSLIDYETDDENEITDWEDLIDL